MCTSVGICCVYAALNAAGSTQAVPHEPKMNISAKQPHEAAAKCNKWMLQFKPHLPVQQ
jgi:hypothetical protein